MFYAALGLGIAATILFLVVRVRKGGVAGLLTKTLASIFFILTAVFACVANPKSTNSYGVYIIAGLIFGMLGDIWLDLKWVYPKDNDVYTFAGMISFTLCHVFYLYAIYSVSGAFSVSCWYLIAPLLIAASFGIIAVSMGKFMNLNYGKFKGMSMLYGATLAFMTFASFSALMAGEFKSSLWLVMTIGGAFFIVSDLILSGMYFDKDMSKNTPMNVVLNHVTYYVAQFLIAASIMFY